MTAEPRCSGGVSHPLQLTTGLVIKSVTTSPTLAGEHMLFILQVGILSEQTAKVYKYRQTYLLRITSSLTTSILYDLVYKLFQTSVHEKN